MSHAHYPGANVRASLTVTSKTTGAKVDPVPLVVLVQNPAGTITSLTYGVDAAVVRDALGEYHVDIAVPSANDSTAVGDWFVRAKGTGSSPGSGETFFNVKKSGVATP